VITAFAVSASQLSLFQLCPRSWFLKHILRAPDDAGAGGLYLTRGNDFDRLVQLRVRDGVNGDPGAPKLANRQLYAAARHLPPTGTAAVQFAYDVDAGGFRVRGKPDIRRPGWVKDTKTTSDRGPGRGKDKDSPPYALTDAHTPGGNLRPLADNIQARLYAWCEFQLTPLPTSYAEWVYVSKADCPVCWTTAADFERADTEAWFDRVVRPIVAEMLRLTESGLPPADVSANPDSCRRCFVRAACPGAFEGVNVYGINGPVDPNRKNGMAFDLSKLRAPKPADGGVVPVPRAALADQLAASVAAAVAINRPASDRPAPLAITTASGVTIDCSERPLVVHTIEGTPAALAMLGYEPPGHDDSANTPSDVTGEPSEAEALEQWRGGGPQGAAIGTEVEAIEARFGGGHGGSGTTTVVAIPPKGPRRGRPRKTTTPAPTPGVDTAAVTPTPTAGVSDTDGPLAPTPPTSAAPECAPSAGDLAVAVRALIDALVAFECHGTTGRHLADAQAAVGRGRGGAQ